MKKKWAIGLLVLVFGACMRAHVKLENIPLMWKPTSEVKLAPGTLSGIVDTKVQFEEFKDVRKQPELIAENREEATPKPVTTKDNVGAFVSTHLRTAFDRVGLTTVDNGGHVIIGGDVKQFFVDETDTYKGHVLLRVNVRNRAGKTLWTGAATGEATRFGHSYRAENYYEVFSDSILSAASSLLQDGEFRAALAKKE